MKLLNKKNKNKLGHAALFTDLYALTMAQGYYDRGLSERQAVFHLGFRKNPFGGNFAILAGLEDVIDYVDNFSFTREDIRFLSKLPDPEGNFLFKPAFLRYLSKLKRLSVSINAIPEGTLVFGGEPLLRVEGPLLQCQLLETALLNLVNFQTLIATKAALICQAAQGDPVYEFGTRRAQGFDGALSACRSAYIGGCTGTSNVLAGNLLDIPVVGTQAHSWVMSFAEEAEAFGAYADSYSNNLSLLVDTYDTITGVRNAIRVAKNKCVPLKSIRLDSGDLCELSKQARILLDEAGFPSTKIMASNDLDDKMVADLKKQGAKINVWGVGTNLVTGGNQSALGGVYKLAKLQDGSGNWVDKVKLSGDAVKTSTPGRLNVLRLTRLSYPKAYINSDVIVDEVCASGYSPLGLHSGYATLMAGDIKRPKSINYSRHHGFIDRTDFLLTPIFVEGRLVYKKPTLAEIRAKAVEGLAQQVGGDGQITSVPIYMENNLLNRKENLINAELRKVGC